MIVEGLFVYLPTIIAITIAFFVGVGTGMVIVGVCGILIWKLPPVKSYVISWLKED